MPYRRPSMRRDKMKKLIITISISLFFLSCAPSATVQIETSRPNSTNKIYKSVLISLPGLDYINQKHYEDLFANLITSTCPEILVSKSYELFPPTEKFSKKEVKNILSKSKIECIFISETASHEVVTNSSVMPITTLNFGKSNSTTYGTYDNTSFQATTKTRTVTPSTSYIPYTYSTAYVSENAYLIDIKTDKTVWFASLRASGSSMDAINKKMMNKQLSELYNGLIGNSECYDNLLKQNSRKKNSRNQR